MSRLFDSNQNTAHSYIQALRNSKDSIHQPQFLPIYKSTKGIIFLGTPHGGSSMAHWGLLVANLTKFALQGPNTKVLNGLQYKSEILEDLRKAFLNILEDNNFHIHSFYETKGMLGLYGLQDEVSVYEQSLCVSI